MTKDDAMITNIDIPADLRPLVTFSIDDGGGLELDISGIITVKAIGLITTRMPDGSDGFALLVIIIGLGGGIGGAAGAAIGNEIGGREGAIVGGALGGAVGAAYTTDESRQHKDQHRDTYYESTPRYQHPGSHFCPPGQAKKGRC